MSAPKPQASGAPADLRSGKQLGRGSIGVPGVVFFVVATAAPLAAVLGAGPVVFIFAGVGGPAMFVIAAVVLLLFGVGLAALSRYTTSAGGFTAFAAKGLGRHAGYLMAGIAVLAYAGMLIGLFGQFSVFTADLFSSLFGWAVPWQAIAIGGVVIAGVFGYRDIQLSAKVLGVLMVLEVVILIVFDVAVIAVGGSEGINFDAFTPANVVTPEAGVGLLFAFACFVGFEATVIYGEESKNPHRTIPRATYISIALIGLIYATTMWALGLAYGSGQVQGAAIENPVEFVFTANTLFVGEWSTSIMRVLVVTSLLAVILALHNTLSRYVFSLGRAGFLPRSLGAPHRKHGSPALASVAVTVLTTVVLLVFALAQADPFAVIYFWLVGIGTLGVLVLQAAGAASVVGFFMRNRSLKASVWARLIAPTLGGIGLVVAIVLAVINFPLLTGVTTGPLTFLPLLVVIAAVVGLLVGLTRSRGGDTVDLTEGAIDADAPADVTPPASTP